MNNEITSRRGASSSLDGSGGALRGRADFFVNTFSALHSEAADKAVQAATGRDSNISVSCNGCGNDGLNTVVPYANDHYHSPDPGSASQQRRFLKLNTTWVWHPNLGGFKELYDAASFL